MLPVSSEQVHWKDAQLDGGAREVTGFDEPGPQWPRLEPTLREVVEKLAAIERTPCSVGERDAAAWLLERMQRIDGVDVALEDEPSWGTFPPTATGLGLLGMLSGVLALRGRRAAGALLAAGSLAGIVDEAQNGPRILRRVVRRRRTTVNLIARVGERPAGRGAGEARSMPTLVVLA